MFTIINAIKTWVTAEINKLKIKFTEITDNQASAIAKKLDKKDYVNSDWSETSVASKAFIKNRPFGLTFTRYGSWQGTGDGTFWYFKGVDDIYSSDKKGALMIVPNEEYSINVQISSATDSWGKRRQYYVNSVVDPFFDGEVKLEEITDDDIGLHLEVSSYVDTKLPSSSSTTISYNIDSDYSIRQIQVDGPMYKLHKIDGIYISNRFDGDLSVGGSLKLSEYSMEYYGGNCSLNAGSWNSTNGNYSAAFGSNTSAQGVGSIAEGYYTIAKGNYQHALGRNNVGDDEINVMIVGNGTSGATKDRSNAFTLDWSGNGWFSGDVYVGSTSGKDKDAGSKKLATEDYVKNIYKSVAITDANVQETQPFTNGFRKFIPDALFNSALAAFPNVTFTGVIDGGSCTLVPTGKRNKQLFFTISGYKIEIVPISTLSDE